MMDRYKFLSRKDMPFKILRHYGSNRLSQFMKAFEKNSHEEKVSHEKTCKLKLKCNKRL